jgi:hypothetical protein
MQTDRYFLSIGPLFYSLCAKKISAFLYPYQFIISNHHVISHTTLYDIRCWQRDVALQYVIRPIIIIIIIIIIIYYPSLKIVH